MLINEIGVKDEGEVVELDRFREAPDPKSRVSMTTILADALASAETASEPEETPASVVSLAPAASEAPSSGEVGHAA